MSAPADAVGVYLFGCRYGQAGHFWWPRRMKGTAIGGPVGFPWERVDGALTPKDRARQGSAALHHLNGWTALAFHDYLIDSRPGSNTVIAVNAEVTAEDAIALALAHFPDIAERLETIDLAAEIAPGRADTPSPRDPAHTTDAQKKEK